MENPQFAQSSTEPHKQAMHSTLCLLNPCVRPTMPNLTLENSVPLSLLSYHHPHFSCSISHPPLSLFASFHSHRPLFSPKIGFTSLPNTQTPTKDRIHDVLHSCLTHSHAHPSPACMATHQLFDKPCSKNPCPAQPPTAPPFLQHSHPINPHQHPMPNSAHPGLNPAQSTMHTPTPAWLQAAIKAAAVI